MKLILNNEWKTNKDPNTPDGLFRFLSLGNTKFHDGYVNSEIYNLQMTRNTFLGAKTYQQNP